jgi:hypothetical protein
MSKIQASPKAAKEILRLTRSRRGKESDRVARREARKLERAKRAATTRLRIRSTLREARESLIDGAPEKRKRALENLNRLASIALSPRARAALQATVADGEARRGRIQEALAAYRLAKQTAAQNPRAYLRGALGEIILLLSQGQVPLAYQAAQGLLQQATAHHNQYKATQATRLQQAISGQVIQATVRPIHPAIVAARLGRQFHTAGALDQAQALYQEAIRLHPRGAVKAKAWLASILLRQGKTQEAQTLTRDALRRGKGKSRALGIWPTLIAAEQASGKTLDLNKTLAILQQSTPRVRARQVHALVIALRRSGDPRWSQVITAWRNVARPAQKGNKRRPANILEHQEFPEINLNLEKIELAELKKQYPTPTAAIRAKCQSILSNPCLSSREFIQVAKDYLRTLSPTEIPPAIRSLEQNAEKCYPHPTARLAIRHSLAKEAAALGQLAPARSLWQQTIAQTPSGTEWWGKALWALAREEKKAQRWQQAAKGFETIAAATGIPTGLQIMTRLEWLDAMLSLNDSSVVESSMQDLLAVLNNHGGYELWLSVARRLLKIKNLNNVKHYVDDIIYSGKNRGLLELDKANSTKEKCMHANRLMRFMAYDEINYLNAIDFWENLIVKNLKIYNDGSPEWWEMVSIAIRGYGEIEKPVTAKNLYNSHINDPLITDYGMASIMMAYADVLRYNMEYAAAEYIYKEIIHKYKFSNCINAYNHMMLIYIKRNDQNSSKRIAQKIVEYFNGTESDRVYVIKKRALAYLRAITKNTYDDAEYLNIIKIARRLPTIN